MLRALPAFLCSGNDLWTMADETKQGFGMADVANWEQDATGRLTLFSLTARRPRLNFLLVVERQTQNKRQQEEMPCGDL